MRSPRWQRVDFADLQPYQPTIAAMNTVASQIASGEPEQIWFLQHEGVITRGARTNNSEIFAPPTIPVVEVERGGKATWHGPGQLVVYPLVRFGELGLGVRQWVHFLLQTSAKVLEFYNLDHTIDYDQTGVYGSQGKIVSLGIRVRAGVSTHGISINVDLVPNGFLWIDPCGISGGTVDQLVNHADCSMQDIADKWWQSFDKSWAGTKDGV